MTVLARIAKDARLYLRLRFPGASPSLFQLARIWCISPGLWVLVSHRLGQYHTGSSAEITWLATHKRWSIILVRFARYLSRVLVKCDLESKTNVGAGVFLSNHGHIVLGARSIGSGTMIHQRVTIGMDLMEGKVPEIGKNVWIGPDCVIYGEITVGDGATVLPCTVLTKSIPPGSVVQGNPARIIKRQFENSKLRDNLSTDCESLISDHEPQLP